MAAITNVVVAGASGNLGPAIIQALLDAGQFQVTVLTRSATSQFASSVKAAVVDYTSVASLTAALKGQHAVISTLSPSSHESELNLISACAAAGVVRYFPSEYGCDIANPKARKLPIFRPKIQTEERLKETVSQHPGFSYTIIRNVSFLDWGLAAGALFDFKSATPDFYDGGDRVVSASNISTIGKAIVAALNKPEQTANRALHIQDAAITQRRLLEIAQKLNPGRTWTPVTVSTEELESKANALLAQGILNKDTVTYYLTRAMFGEGFGGQLGNLDNELLGLKEKTDLELEELIKPLL